MAGPGSNRPGGRSNVTAAYKSTAARGVWIVFEDEASQAASRKVLGTRRPDAGRPRPWPWPWLRTGFDGGMGCFRPGERSRPIYSFSVHRGRKGEPKGSPGPDYRGLIVRAHH